MKVRVIEVKIKKNAKNDLHIVKDRHENKMQWLLKGWCMTKNNSQILVNDIRLIIYE